MTNLPVSEAMRIQEALKPLGYVIRRYRDKWRPTYELVLHLVIDRSRPGDAANDPGAVADCGKRDIVRNLDNIPQGT